MSDDAFYSPHRTPPPRRQPTPGEPLWTLRLAHVTWSAELRCHGESWGWEAQILREGELVIGRRFDLRRLAEQWAQTSDAAQCCLNPGFGERIGIARRTGQRLQ
jgi:hypothetical protein